LTTIDRFDEPISPTLLHDALDAEVMSKRLSRFLGGAGGLKISTARFISCGQSNRAVIGYETVGPGGPGPVLIGKIYSDKVRASRAHTMLESLHASRGSGIECGVPRPVAYLADLGMSLYQASGGHPLDRLKGEELRHGVHDAACWLANLHRSTVPLDRRFDLSIEMGKLTAWEELVIQREPAVASMAAELLARIDSLGRRIRLSSSVPIHKDFHYQHVLIENGRVVVIDLDEMRAGDPSLDVAHFGAYLRLLAFRTNVPHDDLSGLESLFTDTYASIAEYECDVRHRLFTAYTCLKIAKQLVSGSGPLPPPTGQELSRQLKFVVEHGVRSLDGE
jgi:hypothetical protein